MSSIPLMLRRLWSCGKMGRLMREGALAMATKVGSCCLTLFQALASVFCAGCSRKYLSSTNDRMHFSAVRGSALDAEIMDFRFLNCPLSLNIDFSTVSHFEAFGSSTELRRESSFFHIFLKFCFLTRSLAWCQSRDLTTGSILSSAAASICTTEDWRLALACLDKDLVGASTSDLRASRSVHRSNAVSLISSASFGNSSSIFKNWVLGCTSNSAESVTTLVVAILSLPAIISISPKYEPCTKVLKVSPLSASKVILPSVM